MAQVLTLAQALISSGALLGGLEGAGRGKQKHRLWSPQPQPPGGSCSCTYSACKGPFPRTHEREL